MSLLIGPDTTFTRMGSVLAIRLYTSFTRMGSVIANMAGYYIY